MASGTKEKIALAGITMLIAIFNLNLVYENNALSFYFIAVILFAAMVFMITNYKEPLLYFLVFTIPVSVSVYFGNSSSVSGPSELICALLAVYFGFKYFSSHTINYQLLKHPISILIALDLLWLFISSALSEMPDVSFKRFLIRLVYVIVYYFMFAELFQSDYKKIIKVFLFYCLGLSIPILYYLYQHQQIGFAIQGSTKFSQPFYNDHTVFGAVLVYFLPFLFFFTFKYLKNFSFKWFYVLYFLLFLVAVFFSYSRAAWLSLFCALGVYLLIHYKVKARSLVISGISLILLLLVFSGPIVDYFERNKDQSHGKEVGNHFKSVTNINTDASNVERINRWKCAYRMFLDKPLIGFGPGTYQFFYGNYQVHSDFNYNSTYSGDKGHAHSEYLNYLSETGIFGLIVFLISIFVVCRTAIRLLYRNVDKQIKQMVMVLFMALITFYIHSFFNGFIESDKMAMPVFAAMAAIAVLDLKSKQKL